MGPVLIENGGACIMVHGGARQIQEELIDQYLEGVKTAVCKGYEILTGGGSAVDAAVAAVSVMENDPLFNAGYGSALTVKGEVEADAIVIDGKTLDSGAVCSLKGYANPVQAARIVMDKTNHCLLSGEGASEFLESQGLKPVPNSQLVSPRAKAEWEKYSKFSVTVDTLLKPRSEPSPSSLGCDTVGAIAVDDQGNMASATSTGGLPAKLPGRVGDTPIIGSGAYADNNVGAVSTTGHGEAIMKVCLARRVAEMMERGKTAQQAAEAALAFMQQRIGTAGGLIVLSKEKNNRMAYHFTTSHMSWAAVENNTLSWGINPGQKMTAPL